MEQVLPADFGEVTSRKAVRSSVTNVWALGFNSWSALKSADVATSNLVKSRLLNYVDMRGTIDCNYSKGAQGYQSFVSSRRPRPSWNNCTNFKNQFVSYTHDEMTAQYNQYTTVHLVSQGRQPRIYPAGLAYRDEAYLNGFVPRDTMFASSRAWNTMQPRFESECNLMLSILEAKEVRELASLLKPARFKVLSDDFLRICKRLKVSELAKRVPKTALADLTEATAESWLTVMLAIMPTLSDLHAIFDAINSGYQRALDDFALKGVEGNTRYYSEVLYQSDSLSRGTYNHSHELNGTSTTVKFNAAMNYRYAYNIKSKFEAIKRFYGLGGGISTFWEHVTLSFVIDYVLTIGKALKAMERDPNVHDLTVMNYSESILSTFRSGNFIDENNSRVCVQIFNGKYIPPLERSSKRFVAGSQSSLYRRVLTQPVKGTYIPRFKKPTGKQAATMLALIVLFM